MNTKMRDDKDVFVYTDAAPRINIGGLLYTVAFIEKNDILPKIITEDGEKFYLVESEEDAKNAVMNRYIEMSEGNISEIACFIGEERILAWGLGQSDNYGISSFDQWLDTVSYEPEKELASDGDVWEVYRYGSRIVKELKFEPQFAYKAD